MESSGLISKALPSIGNAGGEGIGVYVVMMVRKLEEDAFVIVRQENYHEGTMRSRMRYMARVQVA